MLRLVIIVGILTTLISCAKPNTSQVAQQNGFKQQYIATEKFNLASFAKIQVGAPAVNIYIEGDGRAWINRNRISNDPSPRSSTTMQLAAVDPNPSVVYLARPCQYSPGDLTTVCEAKYWAEARYSDEVVKAIDQAITKIKIDSKAKTINLIGYSGGGALAVLVSAQRKDIASIRTVAGNLDLIAMQEFHKTTPLNESLDPLQVAGKVAHIPQLHFVGDKDKIVPPHIAQNFCGAAAINHNKIVILNNVSHSKGWQENWPKLLEQIP